METRNHAVASYTDTQILFLPRHSRLVVPVAKNPCFTVHVDGQIAMNPYPLAFRMLVPPHGFLVEIHQKLTLTLETGIGRDKLNRVSPGRDAGQFLE